jgi:hypothetical protein
MPARRRALLGKGKVLLCGIGLACASAQAANNLLILDAQLSDQVEEADAATTPTAAPAAEPATTPAAAPSTSAAAAPDNATAQPAADDVEITPSTSPNAVPYDPSRFSGDPVYAKGYDSAAQQFIYGGKHKVLDSPRPAIEWGYPQYDAGPLPGAKPWFGEKNLARPQFMVFGDWRNAVADNNNTGNNEIGQVASRLNLDFDLGITGTERIHWAMRPLDKGGLFTRYEFSGENRSSKVQWDGNFNSFFFEGDAGAIAAGLTNEYKTWDMPIAFGLTPLFVQNGIWLNDAVSGLAVTIPARNSPMLNISNMDFTFFAASSLLSTAALRDPAGTDADHAGQLIGVTWFADMLSGYAEAGYGYTHDIRHFTGGGNFSYHNVTAAFTRRYFGRVSNSVRVIANFGQSPPPGMAHTADGYLILVENSFITAHELTLVPYANFWYGEHHPESLARATDAGGVLVNTGINFETDGLTGFPNLDGTAQDTFGGALGLEYLFDLHQQIVGEIADVTPHGNDNPNTRPARGNQLAAGLRYQLPLSNEWILRADTMYGLRADQNANGHNDISGIRLEIRRKF